MQTIEIKCDACGADLADAGGMPRYRLRTMTAERKLDFGLGVLFGFSIGLALLNFVLLFTGVR